MLGYGMISSFSVAAPERREYWIFMAKIYVTGMAVFSVCSIGLAIAIFKYRRSRKFPKSQDAGSRMWEIDQLVKVEPIRVRESRSKRTMTVPTFIGSISGIRMVKPEDERESKTEGSGPDIARSSPILTGSWMISSHGAGRVHEVYGSWIRLM
jgi:hypothetical protein